MNDTTMIRLVGAVTLEAAASDKPRRLSIVAYNGDVMSIDGVRARGHCTRWP